jgi:tryptophan halogenase
MISKVKNIVIFGGGTSGWLTAAYMVNNLKIPTKITLIEDTTSGPIGVGEGTQPLTAQFLHQCGIKPKMWMKPSNASFKFGVELVGWNDEPYFVDNDTINNAVISEDFYTSDYFLNKDPKEFRDWHPAYQLAKENICPKIEGSMDVNFGSGEQGYGAVHFSAYEILTTIKEILADKIVHIDTKIEHIEKDMYGITKLIDIQKKEYTADLFIDCSGFNSLLLEKTLGSPFTSYSEYLPCDKAVVIQTQYTDPEKECFPYTRATTMTSGWRFTIPIFSRIGNGYVYSSKFISKENAEKELRESVNEHTATARHLDMKCGTHKEIAVKNVCAVGLSAGFVEPLEATSIHATIVQLDFLSTNSLNFVCNKSDIVFESNIKRYNEFVNRFFDDIKDLIQIHYMTKREDTKFWKDYKYEVPKTNIVESILDICKYRSPSMLDFNFYHGSGNWGVWCWTLVGLGILTKDVAHKTLIAYRNSDASLKNIIQTIQHRNKLNSISLMTNGEFYKKLINKKL